MTFVFDRAISQRLVAVLEPLIVSEGWSLPSCHEIDPGEIVLTMIVPKVNFYERLSQHEQEILTLSRKI